MSSHLNKKKAELKRHIKTLKSCLEIAEEKLQRIDSLIEEEKESHNDSD